MPGLGQLAWKAALARDLPLLVVLTVLVAMVIQLSNAAASWSPQLRGQAARMSLCRTCAVALLLTGGSAIACRRSGSRRIMPRRIATSYSSRPPANFSWAPTNSDATTSRACSRGCACPCSWPPREPRSPASLALILGALSGFAGGSLETLLLSSIGVVESVPWLFLFLAVRALLPLNVIPSTSIWITFAMLAVLGWTHAARVFQAAAREFRNSDAMVFARACGIAGWRLWLRHALPTLRQVSLTQFTILIPTFILAEAGLGLLGLGVSEPLPSLGNLLRQLENRELVHSNPEVLVPLAVLVVVMLSFRTACGDLELTS